MGVKFGTPIRARNSPQLLWGLLCRRWRSPSTWTGGAFDNVFIEWVWPSLKYEPIYPGDVGSGEELREALSNYRKSYHLDRPHHTLGDVTSADFVWHRHSDLRGARSPSPQNFKAWGPGYPGRRTPENRVFSSSWH